MARPPNLVIFNPDQWRGDVLGHLGNPAAQTPNLDRSVAEDAVSFSRAFCQNPVCTPSRCSFMTGWYPHTAGHRTMFHMLHRDEPLLLEQLRAAGYHVWWGGKNDLIPGQDGSGRACDAYNPCHDINAPNTHGERDWRGEPGGDNWFSFLYGKIETPPEGLTDPDWCHLRDALAFIRSAPSDRPFCIFLSLCFPHPPYACEEPWFSSIDRSAIPPRIPAPADWSGKPSLLAGIHRSQGLSGWDEARWRELRAVYYAMCARVDHQWGLLVEALRAAGSYDQTAMFCFADHGDFTGDYGLVEKTQNTFEDCLTRVPFVVKPPAATACRPGVRDALIELVDFSATVYDLAGIQPEYTSFGRSLLPVIAGATAAHRDAVFCEGGRLPGEGHCMELQSLACERPEDLLYWPRIRYQTRDDGPEHLKATMIRTAHDKYVRRYGEDDEYYDLVSDPGECINRIHDPACRVRIAELRERMLGWYQETCDAVPWHGDSRNFGDPVPDWQALMRKRAQIGG